MSKYKVGDKVLIEGEVVGTDNSQMINTRIAFKDNTEEWFNEQLLFNATKTYCDGLADAWELARKVALYNCDKEDAYSVTELKAIFNKTSLQGVFSSYTIQQALAKIEAYEKSQQIQVGDVVYADDEPTSFGVVTHKDSERLYIMWNDGSSNKEIDWSDIHKTGRTVDIQHILEQIRGDQ